MYNNQIQRHFDHHLSGPIHEVHLFSVAPPIERKCLNGSFENTQRRKVQQKQLMWPSSRGQDFMTQASLSSARPWHGLPPFSGGKHWRVLVFKPSPQLWLHAPQAPQLDQEACTVNQVLEDELFTFHLKIFHIKILHSICQQFVWWLSYQKCRQCRLFNKLQKLEDALFWQRHPKLSTSFLQR